MGDTAFLKEDQKTFNREHIVKKLMDSDHIEFKLPLNDSRCTAYSHIQRNSNGTFYTMIYFQYGVEYDTGAPIGDEIEEDYETLNDALDYLEDFINAEEDF